MAACACVMGGSSIRGRLSERHEQGYLKLGLDRVIKGDCYIFTRPHKDRQACTPVNHTHEPHERKCQVRTQGERRGGGERGGKRDREREGEEGRGTERGRERREEGQRKGGKRDREKEEGRGTEKRRDREEEGQRNGGTERGTEDHGAHSRAYEAHAQPAWPHP